MKKPYLFIDPVGTMLVDSEHPDHFLEAGIAPYAGSFLAWATKHFNVRWLTMAPPSHTFRLAEQLGVPGHAVPYASFGELKSDAIKDAHSSFWMDTHLTPMDVSWLHKHGVADRFLAVHTPEGVTEGHKEWLAGKINVKRR